MIEYLRRERAPAQYIAAIMPKSDLTTYDQRYGSNLGLVKNYGEYSDLQKDYDFEAEMDAWNAAQQERKRQWCFYSYWPSWFLSWTW